MTRIRSARREQRRYQQELRTQRARAGNAADLLWLQYQRHVGLVLGTAAGAGLLSGWQGSHRLRPPTPLLRAAFSWSMLLLRGIA